MDRYRNQEYATSSHNTKALRSDKDTLRAQGYPRAAVEKLVDTYLHVERFKCLESKDNVFLPAPSTTRTNIIPVAFAARLRGAYGGEMVIDWAKSLNVTKAANKGGLTKLRDPIRVDARPEFYDLAPGRNYILVDDVVTTGQTTDALRALLRTRGIEAATVVSLGQSEMRLATSRDLERITEKLGEPSLRQEVEAVFAGKLKHFANYIEREIRPGTREEVRGHLVRTTERVFAAHAIYPGAKGSLRVGHPVDSRLQFGPENRAGLFGRHFRPFERLPCHPDERALPIAKVDDTAVPGSLRPEVCVPEGQHAATHVVHYAGRAFVVTVDGLKDRPGALPTFRLSDALTGEPLQRISVEVALRAPASGCIHVQNSGACAGLADALARSKAFAVTRELPQGAVVEMRVIDRFLLSHLEQHERVKQQARARQAERLAAQRRTDNAQRL